MQILFNIFLFLIGGYLVGAFPTGYFFARLFSNVDLRLVGSGTIGACNAGRVLGPIGFILVFLCDMGKAYGFFVFASFFLPSNSLGFLFLSIILILGNLFSFGSLYPQGKGVSAALGALLYFNMKLFLLFIIVWIIIVLICKIPTCASLLSLCFITIVSFCYNSTAQTQFFLIVLHPILFYTHRIMLRNILFCERFTWSLKQLRMRLQKLKR